jgi:hypothetical protein
MCSLFHITRLLSARSTHAQGHTATQQVRQTINAAQLMQCRGNSKCGTKSSLTYHAAVATAISHKSYTAHHLLYHITTSLLHLTYLG